jgi:hypothetical protein
MMIGWIALVAGAAITFAAVAMTLAGVFLTGIAIAGLPSARRFSGPFVSSARELLAADGPA